MTMRIAIFCHSLLSDWNHGNAHFLRGVTGELLRRGHSVKVYEPKDAWSLQNLLKDEGQRAVEAFHRAYPALSSQRYRLEFLDLERELEGVELVLVHEWNDPALVAAVGEHRRRHGRYKLLFHDTHHRAVSAPHELERFDLRHYDGALVFGQVLADVYRRRGWAKNLRVWHEAADPEIFRPQVGAREGDVVWIGNWGDGERDAELHEFLLGPVRRLGLRAAIHGVRYPAHARQALKAADIEYRGWVANHRAPEVFARYRVTVHVPRRQYVEALPGIPTIRVFEALACGIPLICSPWEDREELFRPGQDYLIARSGREMETHLRHVLEDPVLARSLRSSGLETIRARHTCSHRVDELMEFLDELSESPDGTLAGMR